MPGESPRWLSPVYADPKGREILALSAHCPACDEEHVFRLAVWPWNGDYERPTFEGSMLSVGMIRCHSFLENGRWRFLADCTHALAGQADIPMVPIKDWGEIPPEEC